MGNHKLTRSQLSHSTPTVKVGGRTKPQVSADYIVGLTDGEGCFYVLIRPPYSKVGGARVQLRFFIKVQERDKGILDTVRKTLGCGAVYFQHEKRANHTQCYRYTINNYRDIFEVIIPFFKEHPLLGRTKRKSFAIFCRIAEMVSQGKHHSKIGIEKIRQLKSQMNQRTRVVREIRSLRSDVRSRRADPDNKRRLGNAK